MNQTLVVEFQHAIRKINTKPAEGVFGFLVPNGAGKTTTICIMVCLIKITQS